MDLDFLKNYKPKKINKKFISLLLNYFFYFFGYRIGKREVISNEIMQRWDIRLPFLLNKLKEYLSKDLIIFDVGSHVGESIFFYKRLFEKSLIYSFEPDTSFFNKSNELIKYFNFQNCNLHNFALGKKRGFKKFYKVKNINNISESTGSSFVQPIDHNTILKTYEYPLTTGDIFSDENNISNIDIIKINVQGMELDVLEGFEKMLQLNKIKIVLVEFDYSPRYKTTVTIGSLENYLNKFNYHLFDMVLLRRKKLKGTKNDYIKISHGFLLFTNNEINKKFLSKLQ